MAEKRTILKDIAAKTGYHLSTVSAALRGRADIAQSTQQKIKEAAEELGYEPDGMLNALSHYRIRAREKAIASAIGIVTRWPRNIEQWGWGQNSTFSTIKEYGAKHGYHIDVFSLKEYGSEQNIERTLRNRGIKGLIIPAGPTMEQTWDLDVNHFSIVSVGYSLAKPYVPQTSNHHWRNMHTMLKRCVQYGYRRVGFTTDFEKTERNIDFLYLSAYQAGVQAYDLPKIPCIGNALSITEQAFSKWLVKHKPEVLLSTCYRTFSLLGKQKLKIPDDIAYAQIPVNNRKRVSGIMTNQSRVGEKALDMLVGRINRNEVGETFPKTYMFVEGDWNEGRTLPKRGAEK